jgi:hypothetical protein
MRSDTTPLRYPEDAGRDVGPTASPPRKEPTKDVPAKREERDEERQSRHHRRVVHAAIVGQHAPNERVRVRAVPTPVPTSVLENPD